MRLLSVLNFYQFVFEYIETAIWTARKIFQNSSKTTDQKTPWRPNRHFFGCSVSKASSYNYQSIIATTTELNR